MWILFYLLMTGVVLVEGMSRNERASVKALYTKFVVSPKCCTNYDGHSPCGQELNSINSKNGTFTSPNYPDPYSSNVYCVYKFVGKPEERVQISFTDFDLFLPEEPPRDCEGFDAVMIFITINGRRERLDNFCGNKLPAQLMSNGPTMEVEFRSYRSSPEVKGFRAIYRFVTDFGISATKQSSSSSECRFLFSSEERGNGTFSSPNYPGFYPRDTECHYTFRGKDKERVHITFAYFDVDGIPPNMYNCYRPEIITSEANCRVLEIRTDCKIALSTSLVRCLSETASDYVEFSNYKTVDRKLARHCGNQKPKLIESDADFFRVIFKSNDKFDATGFEAFYQFRKQVDPFTVKRVSNVPRDSKSSAYTHRINLLILFIFPILLT